MRLKLNTDQLYLQTLISFICLAGKKSWLTKNSNNNNNNEENIKIFFFAISLSTYNLNVEHLI